jgi:predicted transcriptional regulator of viral defense system
VDSLLKPFAGLVVSHATLTSVLSDYQAANFKIHRWLDEGALISLKRGLYAVPDAPSQLSLPLIANHLYGPSYVSMEFMLSHYGLIPERVLQVTSVTIRRGKVFENRLARFSYQRLPVSYYALGIDYVRETERVGFMVASREKALCDWLALTPNLKIYSTKGLRVLLLEDMRMDEELLSELDTDKVMRFAQAGFKTERLMWLARLLTEGV